MPLTSLYHSSGKFGPLEFILITLPLEQATHLGGAQQCEAACPLCHDQSVLENSMDTKGFSDYFQIGNKFSKTPFRRVASDFGKKFADEVFKAEKCFSHERKFGKS